MKEKKKVGPGAKFKEGFEKLLDTTRRDEYISSHFKQLTHMGSTSGTEKTEVQIKKVGLTGHAPKPTAKNGVVSVNAKGTNGDLLPNSPRPPNATTIKEQKGITLLRSGAPIENEEFEDAADHVIAGSNDSDMEIVEETPILGRQGSLNQ
jgi:hypothetical protein